MGMGIPVLLGVVGESAEIVLSVGVGRTFEPENVDQLVQALLAMRSDTASLATMRANGLAAATRYDRATLAANMLASLQKAVAAS
jgi:glycosyltransferase involved in cell wall biosynthesis